MKALRELALCLLALLGVLPARAGNVLVVVSGADHLDLKHGHSQPSGFYLNELMQPVLLLLDAGHTLTFATPDGRVPTLDPHSVNARSFKGDAAALQGAQDALGRLQLLAPVQSPVLSLARVEQIGVERFDAVFIPGGTAPMQDLVADPVLGRILRAFHQAGKPTALVCHGPAALLSSLPHARSFAAAMTRGSAGKQPGWIYAGYRLTALSDRVERDAKTRGLFQGDDMKFYPQSALQTAGADYREAADPGESFVVTDRELITGENPASAVAVGQALVERLKSTARSHNTPH